MHKPGIIFITLIALTINVCDGRRAPQAITVNQTENKIKKPEPSPVKESPPPNRTCQSPKEISLDLCNHTYPGIHDKTPIKLVDGKEEYYRNHGFTDNTLQEIRLLDLTNDNQDEVLVRINNITGGGSSCASIHYYLFQLKKRVPILIWKFATGCESSGGLKAFAIEDKQLYFELFGNCRVRKGAADAAEDPVYGYTDIVTTTYTKLKFGFHHGKFRLISRSVEPYEKHEIR